MNGVVTLSVGDIHSLRFGKDRIIYAGMPTPDVYSIAQMKCSTKKHRSRWSSSG